MHLGALRLAVNTILLLGQAFLMILEVPFWIPIEIVITLAITLLNLGGLMAAVKKVLPGHKKSKSA